MIGIGRNIFLLKLLMTLNDSPDVGKEPDVEDQLDVENLHHTVVPNTWVRFITSLHIILMSKTFR